MIEHKDILEDLDISLDMLESENKDFLYKAEQGIKIIKQALKKTRDLVADYQFKTNQEEIYFFKNTKPKIYSKLIYYVKLFNIESKRPRSSNKS